MRTLKLLFQSIIYIAILLGLVYGEDYNRGLMFVVGILLILSAKFLAYWIDEKLTHLMRLGTIASISGFFLALGVGVHVRKDSNIIEIMSPFYTHTLAQGKCIDTISLASAYEVYYFSYEPYREDFYVLHTNSDSCELWNAYRRILIAKELSFVDKDLGHGNLQVVKIKNNSGGITLYDLYGRDISDKNFRPHLIDRTPPDITY